MTYSATVALISTTPATVLDDYRRLFEALDGERSLPLALPVQIFATTTSPYPFPSANVAPWQLDAVLRTLHTWGRPAVSRLLIGGAGRLRSDLNRYGPIAARYAIAVEQAPDRQPFQLCLHQADQQHLFAEQHSLLYLAPLTYGPDGSLAGALTAALNSVGHPRRSARLSDEHAIDLLARAHEHRGATLAIIDATTVGYMATPRLIFPLVRNLLLASHDLVALDTIAAALLGINNNRFIERAHQRGLGCADRQKIRLSGDPEGIALVGADQQHPPDPGPPPTLLDRATDLLPAPLRWRWRDRRIFEAWLYGTRWGQLLRDYQKSQPGDSNS